MTLWSLAEVQVPILNQVVPCGVSLQSQARRNEFSWVSQQCSDAEHQQNHSAVWWATGDSLSVIGSLFLEICWQMARRSYTEM